MSSQLRAQRLRNEPQSGGELTPHEVGRKPQDAEAYGGQGAVAAPVRAALARVLRAVHFHDEPCPRREEINDEAVEHDLPPELHAELTAAQRLPKHPLRLRRSQAHAMRVRANPLLPLEFAVLR